MPRPAPVTIATRPSKPCSSDTTSHPPVVLYRPVTLHSALRRHPGVPVSEVLYSAADRIGVITLNRPEARNAVDRAMALGIEAAVDRIEGDPDVWVGVLTANTAEQANPVFGAGADLKVVRETGSAAALDTDRGGFGGFVYRERGKPIVVAVAGLATAGGLEMVLAADVVVATTRSAFGLAEVRRNLIAAAGGLFRLPRAIGRAPAVDAILTGEPIDARRAFELGLVSRLVEPGAALDEAMTVARQIVAAAPLAVRASRSIVRSAAHDDDDTLRQTSRARLDELLTSEDATEGLLAFAEKR